MDNVTLESSIKGMITDRKEDSHKGDYGRILIAAGSSGMCGAAILAAKGAYRSGAGVVTVAIPKEFFPIVHCGTWETVLVDREVPIPDVRTYHSMAVGPGIGKSDTTREFLDWVLDNYKGPLVLDADALNIIGEFQDYSRIKNYQGSLILTPHPGEAQRLLGISSNEYNNLSREEVVITIAKLTGAVVALKGWNSLIADPYSRVTINPTGNPGMATGGTGDVLTGMITALLGRGFKPYDAAVLGVYIHGLAGDIAMDKIGMTSMIAGDLIEYLPSAFMEIERGKVK